MDRKEFINKMGIVGLGGILLPGLFSACSDDFSPTNIDVNFDGKVLIIGAGAAGLMAGYILQLYGVDFEILEASNVHGGRLKEDYNLVDYPIDLGAEWIHTDPKILSTLLQDPTITSSVDIINYSPPEISIWQNNKLRKRNLFSNFYGEHKFKSSTWYSYFENFIVPTIRSSIKYNEVVSSIDYSSHQIIVESSNSNQFLADRIIFTAPLSVLKDSDITFIPSLTQNKLSALEKIYMPDGIKVFIEFSDRFYPDIVYDGSPISASGPDGEKVYYNASYGKESSKNVFALFCVGEQAQIYVQQANEQELLNYILIELDTYFDGKASPKYLNHVIQNWSAEPYIRGSYTHGDYSVLDVLKEPIDNRIYFAGETMAPSDTATVHGAANSAWVAVERLLANGA